MENTQEYYLKTVQELIQTDEILKAIETLMSFDKATNAGINSDLILQSGMYHQIAKMMKSQLITLDQFTQRTAQIRYALSEIVNDLPGKLKLNDQVRGLGSYQFTIHETSSFEKIIGTKDNLLKIAWLEGALRAAKAVCRVVCGDGSTGTGFLIEGGYLLTNNHVLDTPESAKSATLEFNFEHDANGKPKRFIEYKLDASDFVTSDKFKLDFTKVKVINNPGAPLEQWGFLTLGNDLQPKPEDHVVIIQHPDGRDKRIALWSNKVVNVAKEKVHYTTDTEPGSSGAPVFNENWEVVALHHKGETIILNNKQTPVNEGILIKDIVKAF